MSKYYLGCISISFERINQFDIYKVVMDHCILELEGIDRIGFCRIRQSICEEDLLNILDRKFILVKFDSF